MPSESAGPVVEEFLARQRAMYAGGSADAVTELLADDVVWHVPGTSPIAGDHRGRSAVLAYFALRRSLAGGRMGVVKHEAIAHDIALVQLADGTARLGGEEEVRWRTAGVYRVDGGRIAEAWLVPLDLAEFDRLWGRTRTRVFSYRQRVRPQDCAASGNLAHPRFLEFFEAAFVECWRSRFGPLADSLGPERALTVAEVNVHYLGPVAPDEELHVMVSLDRFGRSSVRVHYDAFVDEAAVAEATSRYVCLDPATGRPTPLPVSGTG
jgi:YbgC/YbaW family acyl-CoA thioester hydrolase